MKPAYSQVEVVPEGRSLRVRFHARLNFTSFSSRARNFSAGGSAFESEIWGENEQLMPVLRGQVFQVVALRLRSQGLFEEVKRIIEDDRRLQLDAHRESEFYSS